MLYMRQMHESHQRQNKEHQVQLKALKTEHQVQLKALTEKIQQVENMQGISNAQFWDVEEKKIIG